jgi:hypothetical protein
MIPYRQVFDALYFADIKALIWQDIGVGIGRIHLTKPIAFQVTAKEAKPDAGLASHFSLTLETMENFRVTNLHDNSIQDNNISIL